MDRGKLSDKLQALALSCTEQDISIKELVAKTDSSDLALITMIFSLPYVFFLPLPGLSRVFGIFILINGFRITSGRKLWIPDFFLKKKISSYTLKKILLIARKWFAIFEKFIHPRKEMLSFHPFFSKLNGILLTGCGAFLSLPIPIGVSFLPGLTSLVLSCGILQHDGYCLILGYCLFVLDLILFIAFPFIGFEKVANFMS